MKTLSIRQLHATTGKIVRAARREPVLVTDHGAVVAVLRAVGPLDLGGRPFPAGHWRGLSAASSADSTRFVSDDRDR